MRTATKEDLMKNSIVSELIDEKTKAFDHAAQELITAMRLDNMSFDDIKWRIEFMLNENIDSCIWASKREVEELPF